MKRSNLESMSVDQLVARFVEIALAQDVAILEDESADYRRLYRQMDEVDDELGARGREARLELLRLYEHENMQVRLKAAVRTLAIAPARARLALEAISASQHHPQALDAGMLIQGLDEGTFKPR
jgi:hypothetical protein